MRKRGLEVRQQVSLPVQYDGILVDAGYRLDVLVNDRVVVELKATDQLIALHEAQVLTYLKLSGAPVGLLINFNSLRLREGLKRFVNKGVYAGT